MSRLTAFFRLLHCGFAGKPNPLPLAGVVAIAAVVSAASAQTVQNVTAQLSSDNRDALITYNLISATDDQYTVRLYYSTDAGATFLPAVDNLTGNIGTGVFPGIGLQVRWQEFSAALRSKVGQQVVFRVAAQPDESEFVIQFDDSTSSATEGQGVAYLNLTSTKPFYGMVHYEVSAMTSVNVGTTPDSDMLPLSGSIEMTGLVGRIPVTLFDDFAAEDPKALTVDLKYGEEFGYSLGTTFRHMLTLYDDDGYWNGVMKGEGDADGELPFRMLIANRDGVSSGVLVSGTQSPTAITALPAGTWPLSITWAGGVFSAESAGIDVPSSSLFPQADGLKRRLTFEADPETSGTILPNKTIVGRFQDQLEGAGQSLSYLGGNTEGVFFLMRQQPPFVPPPVPILPAPAAANSETGRHVGDAVLTLPGGTL